MGRLKWASMLRAISIKALITHSTVARLHENGIQFSSHSTSVPAKPHVEHIVTESRMRKTHLVVGVAGFEFCMFFEVLYDPVDDTQRAALVRERHNLVGVSSVCSEHRKSKKIKWRE